MRHLKYSFGISPSFGYQATWLSSPSTRLLGRGSEQEHHDRLRGLNHLMEDIVLAADSADSAHLTRSAQFALEQAGSLRAAGPQALHPFV